MKQRYLAPVMEHIELLEDLCNSISVTQWDDLVTDEE